MKRFVTRLAAIATVGAAASFVPAAVAQAPAGGGTAPATPAPTQRICIVNIAKVLRDYDKANFRGHVITEKRQAYVGQVNALREQLAKINKDFQTSQIPEEKKKFQEQALAVQRKVEDIDRSAQAELTTMSNETIVAVYQEIKGVIKDIAEANGLGMVMCFPAASKTEDDNSPPVAQLMLQTPALIPFYHRGMDITEVVIKTLNTRYPSQKPPAMTGKSEVTPTGGTSPMAPIPGGMR